MCTCHHTLAFLPTPWAREGAHPVALGSVTSTQGTAELPLQLPLPQGQPLLLWDPSPDEAQPLERQLASDNVVLKYCPRLCLRTPGLFLSCVGVVLNLVLYRQLDQLHPAGLPGG